MDLVYKGFAIIELFGHRRVAGVIRDVEVFGGKFLRVDVPKPGISLDALKAGRRLLDTNDDDLWAATQLYGPQAIYGITFTTAEVVLAAAGSSQHAPVSRWELPTPSGPPAHDDSPPWEEPGRCVEVYDDDGCEDEL